MEGQTSAGDAAPEQSMLRRKRTDRSGTARSHNVSERPGGGRARWEPRPTTMGRDWLAKTASANAFARRSPGSNVVVAPMTAQMCGEALPEEGEWLSGLIGRHDPCELPGGDRVQGDWLPLATTNVGPAHAAGTAPNERLAALEHQNSHA